MSESSGRTLMVLTIAVLTGFVCVALSTTLNPGYTGDIDLSRIFLASATLALFFQAIAFFITGFPDEKKKSNAYAWMVVFLIVTVALTVGMLITIGAGKYHWAMTVSGICLFITAFFMHHSNRIFEVPKGYIAAIRDEPVVNEGEIYLLPTFFFPSYVPEHVVPKDHGFSIPLDHLAGLNAIINITPDWDYAATYRLMWHGTDEFLEAARDEIRKTRERVLSNSPQESDIQLAQEITEILPKTILSIPVEWSVCQ